MTKAIFAALLGTWLAWAAVWPACAAETQQPSKPFVVLVGISEYADKEIKPRPHAEDDAKALYDVFTNKDYLGADADHVRLLLGSKDEQRKSQPATRENILKALHWIATEAKRDDLVIFAFIGQGAPVGDLGDRLCYLASDSTFKDRAKNAIATGDIAQELDKLKSQRFCTFLDLSFRGPGGKEIAAELNLENNPYKEFLGNEGKEEHTPALGRVLFLATSGRTQSIDLDKQGLLTRVVVDGLKGAADKEGYEPDGLVTVDELTEYLDKQIPELAHKHGKTKDEKEQLHYVLGGRGSHFVLTHNPAVAAKVKERLDKLAQLAKDKKISAELAEEGHTLLSQMPKLESQRSLRKEYQQLVDGSTTVDKFTEKRDLILDGTKLKRSAALAYAKKVIEAVQTIRDGYVKEVNQGEMVAWAIRGLYRRVDEKIPQEIADRLANVKDLKGADLTVLLADVREKLGKREDLDNHKDIDYSLQQMLRHLDPYTTYIDPETLARFEQDTRGEFTGIGIQIRKDFDRDMLMVVSPIKGSPAYKAGLQAGDVITAITLLVDNAGKPLDNPQVISTKGLPLSDAVKKIQGLPGSKVKISVERTGETKALDFEIKRGKVEMETVLGVGRKPNDDWDFMIDPSSKIAYIRLTSFARNSFRDMSKVLKDLKADKRGIQGLILDLRFNPGGLLDSAVKISDLYVDDGLIVTIKPRVGREQSYPGEHDGSYLDFPMVCLVNGGSASGSEIVAACLQDHHRAIIMGERSYGKGSVQNIQPFEGGELKMTTASFWRPNGKNLNKLSTAGREEDEWGVTPDKGYVLKLSRKERDDLEHYQREQEIIRRHDHDTKENEPEFKDRQLEMALGYLRGQIKTASAAPAKKAG